MTSEIAEQIYIKYHRGYNYIVKDKIKVRELAMTCAIKSVIDSIPNDNEYYMPILDELYTMCEYMNINIKKEKL